MKDITKNLLYFSLGAVNLTRERTKEMVNDLVARGEVEHKEASELVDSIMEKGKSRQEEIRNMFREEANKALSELNIADGARVAALEERVRILEERLSQ